MYLDTINDCAKETGFTQIEIQRWIRAINRHNQAIIYGSPGTGKTFVAEKLAQHLIGGGNGFSELVQFHPAYSYEDFIQGIRPQSENGQLTYLLVPGRFLKFCQEAENRQGICVLIIDEINRANLAQVFGELMYLLEYRDKEITLASGNTFRIPKHIRIIGTMNTADRSIAEFDYALRRRFSFIPLYPNYEVLRRYHQKRGLMVEGLIATLQRLNQAIADKNYEIGISFFLTENLAEDIEDIWCMEIEPYLEEYFTK
ncbi:MAG: AAA family ATPase [Nostocaceae cyanobacterium]|nr:AAA family ATPase [Nostocaceae cyanobacterium]